MKMIMHDHTRCPTGRMHGCVTQVEAYACHQWRHFTVLIAPVCMLLQSDVYALGICMWEVKYPGGRPFARPTANCTHCNRWDKRPKIKPAEELPAGSESYNALMEWCWFHDPAHRPTFGDICTTLRMLQHLEQQRLKS